MFAKDNKSSKKQPKDIIWPKQVKEMPHRNNITIKVLVDNLKKAL